MNGKYASMPMSDYISTCDTIKEKTGADNNHILSGELAGKINDVFEAGKRSEYDEFWDKLQNYGNAQQYNGAFQANMWTDDTYNPKHPIVATGGNNMFAWNQKLTDTKVLIDTSNAGQAFYLFQGAAAMRTIRSLKVKESQTYTSYFEGCSKLKNITFAEGSEIGRSISFASSPLTVESMKSVIEHLVNYVGTTNDGKYTVTFTEACWTALEAYGAAPDGGTWRDYVELTLGWAT